MKIPRFLFEEEDINLLERHLSEKLRKSDKFILLSHKDKLVLERLCESEKAFGGNYSRQMMFRLEVISRIVDLHESAETVADKANVLSLIMSLHHWSEDLPASLLKILP